MNTTEYYLMYLRKSRADDPSETVEEVLAKHERILQNYALTNFEHRIPEENIYREVVSGETIDDRTEIKRLFERMQDARCKGVLVVEPQRLSRGDLIDCGTVMQAFKYTKTLVITPPKTFDLSEKYDYKAFQNELMQGAEYLEYIKEILSRGRKLAVQEGNYLSGIAPYGYKKVKEGKKQYLVIDEEEAPYVQMIFEMYADGIGAHRIANKLHELGAKPRKIEYFSKDAVYKILDNEVYIGNLVWNRHITEKVFEKGQVKKKRVRQEKPMVKEGTHAAIISKELFGKVKEMRGNHSRVTVTREQKNPYTSLLKCKKCGHVLVRTTFSTKANRPPRYKCTRSHICGNKGTNEEPLNIAIVEALKIYLNDFKVKVESNDEEIIKAHRDIVKNLMSQKDDIEKRQEKLYEFLEQGIYDAQTFQDRNAKLAKERIENEAAIEEAKNNVPDNSYYAERYTTLYNTIEALKDPEVPARVKNNFLKSIIEVIYYEKDEAQKSDPRQRQNGASGIKLEIVLK